jgi:AraC-like DNA-binding protein
VPKNGRMIDPADVIRVRDFGCGDLLTIGRGSDASLHYYLRGADRSRCRVEHEYPSHSLVFTNSGEWQYHGTERRTTADARVVVAGRGLAQYACSHPPGACAECFIIAIANDAFDDETQRLFAKSVVPVTPEVSLHRRAIDRAREDADAIDGLAFSLFDAVAAAAACRARTRRLDVRMAYAKRLMRELTERPTTVASIARELHLSRFTFTRRFLAHTGVTPHAYLSGLRIGQAKNQLQTTKLTIEEIALANGFGSIAHFSNAFHRIAGLTPTAFRKLSAR